MIFSAGNLRLFFNKTTFGVERLVIEGDAERISWVRGREFALPCGNNFLVKSNFAEEQASAEFLFFSGLACRLTVTAEKDAAVFRYSFKNSTKKEISSEIGELGVYIPFNDDFDDPMVSLRRRIHAHVRNEGQTYVYCERYSGDLPALGLVVTQGESPSYSLERSGRRSERGKILLDLPAMRLLPEESYEFEFVIFACNGRSDFFRKAEDYGLLRVESEGLTVFFGEEIVLTSSRAICLRTDLGEIPFVDGKCRFSANGLGRQHATVVGEKRSASLTYFVLSHDLYEKRIDFLLSKQFVRDGRYAGAFTAFDRNVAMPIVRGGVRSPFRLGGARATPLLFLLRAGQKGVLPADMRAKTEMSVAFYDREIYMQRGEVADDVGGARALLGKRYYDYPLFAAIRYEEYRYLRNIALLKESGKILTAMYRADVLYEVAPTFAVYESLRREGETTSADALGTVVINAADRLIHSGNKYRPFKGMSYGPEIVCGALATLLDAYMITKNDSYLIAAREHFIRLKTFSFPSLDYSKDEVPEIFQRDRANGLTYDMSPHYTAAFFAFVYDTFYRATEDPIARDLSRRALRAAMTLFDNEGGAYRGKAAPRAVNDVALSPFENISYGEDIVLYFYDLLFDGE